MTYNRQHIRRLVRATEAQHLTGLNADADEGFRLAEDLRGALEDALLVTEEVR